MATIAEALNLALQYHRAGDLQQAERIYRQILDADPSHADARHLLGATAYQAGRGEEAVRSMQQAIALDPMVAIYHCNLGLALTTLGRLDEAVASLRRALQLDPASDQAHFNLANALEAQGELEGAEAGYREALRLTPGMATALNNLGAVYLRQARLGEAADCLRQAIALAPDLADAHYNLGNVWLRENQVEAAAASFREARRLKPDHVEAHLCSSYAAQRAGRLDEGLAHCREALRLQPEHAAAHRQLGVLLILLGHHEAAADCLRRALQLQPGEADTLSCLGNALREQGRLDEAIAHGREAVRLQPDMTEGHNQLGMSLARRGRLEEALACFNRAVELAPDYADGHFNRAYTWLLAGDFARGWPEYEWRWRRSGVQKPDFPQPCWEGEPLAGRTILLHAEQGFGDTFHFIRYAPLVKARGGQVLFECPTPLLQVLRSCEGVDRLVPVGSLLPPFDVHAPLMSLPHLLGTTLENVPARVPYLRPDPARLETWRRRLATVPGSKVGIAWQGDPKHPWDRFRSIPLACFEPLARLPGVRLISLQRGPGADQLDRATFPVLDLLREFDPRAGSFLDTAAILGGLDLLITCDSAVAHLAGALAVPAWVLLPVGPDWRWLLEREDSPWYPTVRLFRQQELGDWPEVFQRLAQALRTWLPAGGRGR